MNEHTIIWEVVSKLFSPKRLLHLKKILYFWGGSSLVKTELFKSPGETPVFFHIAEKLNIFFSNIMQAYFVPSAERLQKLGASSVSLVPVGSANFSKRVTDWPEETVIDGMVRTGADLGSLGSFLTAGVLLVAVLRIESTSSFPTMGNWCKKLEKTIRKLLRRTTVK